MLFPYSYTTTHLPVTKRLFIAFDTSIHDVLGFSDIADQSSSDSEGPACNTWKLSEWQVEFLSWFDRLSKPCANKQNFLGHMAAQKGLMTA